MKAVLLLFVALSVLLVCPKARATNIRGQVVRNTNGTFRPLPNVKVELMIWDGRQWNVKSYTITGGDGFYFFVNVSPGLTFCLRVMGHYYPYRPLTVQNVSSSSYQDLPVIST